MDWVCIVSLIFSSIVSVMLGVVLYKYCTDTQKAKTDKGVSDTTSSISEVQIKSLHLKAKSEDALSGSGNVSEGSGTLASLSTDLSSIQSMSYARRPPLANGIRSLETIHSVAQSAVSSVDRINIRSEKHEFQRENHLRHEAYIIPHQQLPPLTLPRNTLGRKAPNLYKATLDRVRRKSLTPSEMSAYTLPTLGRSMALPGYMLGVMDLDFSCDRLIGEGGAGLMFQGSLLSKQLIQKNDQDTVCVVKIIKNIHGQSELTTRNSFHQEIAIMNLFSGNRCFVKLLGYANDPQCIVMKYYRYGSLEELIHKQEVSKSFPSNLQNYDDCVTHIYKSLANACQQMHSMGIVHNDLKPSNILIDIDDQNDIYTVLCDFGIAQVVEESLYRVKAMPRSDLKGASLAYCAPEVIQMFQSEVRSSPNSDDRESPELIKAADVYSYGIILYQILSKKHPWGTPEPELKETTRKVLAGERPPLDQLYSEESYRPLIEVIKKCWLSNAKDRPSFSLICSELLK